MRRGLDPSKVSRYPTPVDPLKCGDGKKWKNLWTTSRFSFEKKTNVDDPASMLK